MSDFLIVHKKILPPYLEKVIEARRMLENREADTITEAVQKAGISRNTYYKYKDYVFPCEGGRGERKAIFSLILRDEKGALSSVLSTLSDYRISILTISQAVPVSGKANVLLSLDISNLTASLNAVLNDLAALPGVRDVHLDAME